MVYYYYSIITKHFQYRSTNGGAFGLPKHNYNLIFFEDANNRAVYCRMRFIYYGVLNSILYWLKMSNYF